MVFAPPQYVPWSALSVSLCENARRKMPGGSCHVLPASLLLQKLIP
jgi:hypothetical protein